MCVYVINMEIITLYVDSQRESVDSYTGRGIIELR